MERIKLEISLSPTDLENFNKLNEYSRRWTFSRWFIGYT